MEQSLRDAWLALSEEKQRAWVVGWEPAHKDEPFTPEERERAFRRVDRHLREDAT